MDDPKFPTYEWVVVKGDDEILTGAYTNDAGDVEPLTDCEIQMQIRTRPGGKLILAKTSNPAAGITIVEEEGTFAIALTDTETSLFGFAYAWYDVKVEAADGSRKTLFGGRLVVEESTTIWEVPA